MRLLQSVLPTLRQPKKPQQKFVAHLLGLLLMLPGHATFRNLSRSSSYHERTFSRWYARDFDFVSRNKAAITAVIPPEHEQALVIDASCVPESGKKTYGLDRFWNSSHSRTDGYLDQLTHVVSEHRLGHLRYVVTDGDDSKQKFTAGVRALGLEQIGKLRIDANRRYLYQGPQRPGRGRPKTYDGQVSWDNLSHFEKGVTDDDEIVLYHQVLNHVQSQRNLRVVLVVDTKHNRRAVLFSTDINLDALTLYRYDKARFQIEFLCRDAKQCTGLSDCQARSQAKLNLHFNASLSAVTCAKLDARQHSGDAMSVFSMASLKRRAFNQHLIERITPH
jgi:hypothetical protein